MTDAGGVLATSVTVRDRSFRLATFPAGSTPPAWAREIITNPKAWVTAPTVEEEDLIGPAETSSPAPEDPDPQTGEAPRLPKPAQGGAGSGRALWVAYANQEGVAFADDATRDEIADAVEAAERSE